MSFYRDNDSSTAWTIELGNLSSLNAVTPVSWRSIKIFQVIVGCASFSVSYYTMELRGALVGFLLLLWTTVATLLLPCFLLRVTRQLAFDDPSTSNPVEDSTRSPNTLLDKCRAIRPLQIGLYFGLCLSVCGFTPVADMCLLVMLISYAVMGRGLSTTETLVTSVRVAILAASVYSISSAEGGPPWWWPVLETVASSLICLFLFGIIFVLLQCLSEIGTRLGDIAYAQAKHAAGSSTLSNDSVAASVVAVSTWMVSLLLLIAT